jgi:hypothetical protein
LRAAYNQSGRLHIEAGLLSRINPNEQAPSNVQLHLRFAYTRKNDAENYVEANTTADSSFIDGSATQLTGEHMYYVAMRMTI